MVPRNSITAATLKFLDLMISMNKKKYILFTLIFVCIFIQNLYSAEANTKSNSDTIAASDSQPLKLMIEWFSFDKLRAVDAEKHNIIELLRNDIIGILKKNQNYIISNVGEYKLSGRIVDFAINDYTKDKNNIVIEKRISMTFSIDIIDVKNNKNVYTEPGIFIENIFSTEQNPDGRGIPEREAIRNMLDDSVKKINSYLSNFYNKLIISQKPQKKKIELPESKKKLIDELEQEFAQREKDKKIDGKIALSKPIEKFKKHIEINLKNERIMVTSGTVEASGETKKIQDKFETEEKLNFTALLDSGNNSALDGNLVIKTKSYQERKVDLDKILLTYKNDNLNVSLGNVFGQITRTIFTNSLEGLTVDWKSVNKKDIINVIAGRDKEGKDNQYYSRNSAAFGYTRMLNKDDKIMIGGALAQDNKSSISLDTSLIPIKNYLLGASGKFKIIEPLSLEIELTKSYFEPNKFDDTETLQDNAENVKLIYKKEKKLASLEYSRIGADFVTINGIASADKEIYTFNYKDVYKILNYNFGARYQFDDLDHRNNKRNYVKELKSGCEFKPLSDNPSENLKNVILGFDILKSEKYNRLRNSAVSSTSDLSTINAKTKISNRLFKNMYSFNLSFEYECEEDNILNQNVYTRNYEFSNNFKKKIIDDLFFDAKLRARHKIYLDKTENFVNSTLAFLYNKNSMNLSLEYYVDINKSSAINQDSAKHQISFNYENMKKYAKHSASLLLSLTYSENKFEDKTLEYNKLLVNTALKFIF